MIKSIYFKGRIKLIKTLIIAFSIGFLTGVLTHAKRNRHIKFPRINKASFNPGFLLDALFGAVAALVGVLVIESVPIGIERIILISILAGYLGEGLVKRIAKKNYPDNFSKDEELYKTLKLPVKPSKPPKKD